MGGPRAPRPRRVLSRGGANNRRAHKRRAGGGLRTLPRAAFGSGRASLCFRPGLPFGGAAPGLQGVGRGTVKSGVRGRAERCGVFRGVPDCGIVRAVAGTHGASGEEDGCNEDADDAARAGGAGLGFERMLCFGTDRRAAAVGLAVRVGTAVRNGACMAAPGAGPPGVFAIVGGL